MDRIVEEAAKTLAGTSAETSAGKSAGTSAEKSAEKSMAGGRAYWMMAAVVTGVVVWSGSRLEPSTAAAQTRAAFAAGAARTPGAPAASGSVVAGSGLISHFQEDLSGGPTRVILVDPQLKRMVVYHVPVDSGAIQLKSVRNFTVDFQVQAYNSDDPSTIDMEKTLQRN